MDNKKDNLIEKRENKMFRKEKKVSMDMDKELNGGKIKKPFDKKTYRLKKYSNKYKLDQWEEQRKKKLLRNYYKEIKNDPMVGSYKAKSFDENEGNETAHDIGKYVRHPDLIDKDNVDGEIKKKDPFWKAKEQYKKIKEEKLNKQREREKSKEERKQKLAEYKKKKADRFKKLSRKTKKGQPVMTGRLEMLLEKIQQK